jgi:secreted trypsin-like serine protease
MARVGASFIVAASLATVSAATADNQSESVPDKSAIIGGSSAPSGKWPFQVALVTTGWGDNYEAERCGGSLIDKFHVVTAAHCVDGYEPHELRVVTGTQSLVKGGTRRKIAKIRIHPRYDENTTDYDIAVVTLMTPATEVPYFVTLIAPHQERALAKAGTTSVVIGWGSTLRNSGGYPEHLQQVAVPIVAQKDCNDHNSYDGEITDRMICAGFDKTKKDSCDGDSGGPLIVRDEDGRWRLQAGIVSWGAAPCAAPNQPGVYSRVAVLSSWVKRIVANDSSFVAALDCERLQGQGQRSCMQARSRRN